MFTVIAHLRAQWMGAFALFLVIAGGTAYAADTIGSSDIINGEVKSPDIGNNQVYSADVRDDTLANGGLRSIDINNESVLGEDLASDSVGVSELSPGALPQFTYQRQLNTPSDTTTQKELLVTCNTVSSTDAVTGGGYVVDHFAVIATRSYAVDEHTWLVRAHAPAGTPAWQLTVIANCIT